MEAVAASVVLVSAALTEKSTFHIRRPAMMTDAGIQTRKLLINQSIVA